MSTLDMQAVRRQAQEIVDRAKADPAFEQQLKDDPDTTLVGLGFPEREIPDFLQEQGLQPEVAGYIQCADFTCWSSNCPASCFVTIRIW
jgi:hypothetical protein